MWPNAWATTCAWPCAPTVIVIVMDVVMPEVDGIELVQWLAQEKCQAKILIVTGYNPHYADAAKRLVSAGDLPSVQTLTKPISLADLRAALA